MSKKPATKVVIRLTMDKNGEFAVEGPMRDPVLFLGMLDLARQRFFSMMAKQEILEELQMQARREAKTPSGLVDADGKKLHLS